MRKNDMTTRFKGIVDRRSVIKAMGAAGIVGGVAGCLGNGNDGGDGNVGEELVTTTPDEWPDLEGTEVYIVAESSTDSYTEFFNAVERRFEHVTNADVTVEFAGDAGGYRNRMAEMIQDGNPPEISHMPINRAATLERDGHLADHSDVIEYWEDFYGSSYTDSHRLVIEDEDMYLPMHSNVLNLWHRGDVIEEPPQTWEEEIQVAQEVDEGSGGTRGHVIFPTISNWTNDIVGYTRGWSAGARFMERSDNGELQCVFDDEEYIDTWIETLEHEKTLYQYSNDNDGLDSAEMNQQIAIEGAYMSYWQGSYPKVNAIDTGVDFAEDVRPAPTPTPAGEELTAWGNIQGQAVFEDANTEAAKEFLKFLAHPENAMGYYFADSLHQWPVLGGLADHDMFADQLEEMPDEWQFPEDSQADWMPNGIDLAVETEPYNPYAGEIAFDNAYSRALNPVLLDDADPEQAIRDVADRVRDIIN